MRQNIFKAIVQLGSAARKHGTPWVLLIARLWFGQVIFVHHIMTMAMHGQAGQDGSMHIPSAFDSALQGVIPVMLSAGVLTRPIALLLLLETVWSGYGVYGAGVDAAKIALLVWLIAIGPGSLSIDNMLRRGLSSIPIRPVRIMRQSYALLQKCMPSALQFAVRAGLAVSLIAFSWPMVSLLQKSMLGEEVVPFIHPAWLAMTLMVALLLGFATRIAALVVAAMVPLAGIAMSIDDRMAVLLLLLLLSTWGGGMFSVDRLLRLWVIKKLSVAEPTQENLPHIVVVGGGFGGVATVQGLRNTRCRITLIDQRNHHLFQPLLYQVATAALSPADIATPIRALFRGQRNVQIRLGQVIGVDTVLREVLVDATSIKFDYLVLATGARHSYFGKDTWAPYAPGLKSIEDATTVRSRLLRAFEEAENASNNTDRSAWLTFVIVGGGPTGIELAGAIAELARHGMDREYRTIDPTTARVILLQSGPRLLPAFNPRSSSAAERSLRDLGVDVRLNTKVLGVDNEGVDVGELRIPAHTVLWAAGVAASPAAQWLGQIPDAAGRLVVGADLSVPSMKAIYAIGDTASSMGWRGSAVPGLAPAAKQQGRYVADVITAQLTNRRPPLPFQYRHFGSLATIGRQAAVVEFGSLRAWGAPAWWFWGAAHIAFLGGSRNRASVILNWIWAYLTYRRSTRLITTGASDKTVD